VLAVDYSTLLPGALAARGRVAAAGIRILLAVGTDKVPKKRVVGVVLGKRSGRKGFAGVGEEERFELEDSLAVLAVAVAVFAVVGEGSRSLVVLKGRPEVGWLRRKNDGCQRGSRSGR
jgi:hypothetical protein